MKKISIFLILIANMAIAQAAPHVQKVTDNVYSYAVELVRKTRPNSQNCPDEIKKFIDFGAGPRASQYLIMGSKMHAILSGKFSPDIEDVRAVSQDVLRHRLVKNYKAEAEGVTVEKIIQNLF